MLKSQWKQMKHWPKNETVFDYNTTLLPIITDRLMRFEIQMHL
jgi:hypothetical protein